MLIPIPQMELGIFVTVDNISSARAIWDVCHYMCWITGLNWNLDMYILTNKRLKAWQPAFKENQTQLTNSVGKKLTRWGIC